MKKICVLASLVLLFACSQKKKPIPHGIERFEMDEYTVVITPAPDSTFGFDIYKFDQLVVHQPTNPVVIVPYGLFKKEDAINLAAYAVVELTQKGKVSYPYPISLIDQLQLTITKPNSNTNPLLQNN